MAKRRKGQKTVEDRANRLEQLVIEYVPVEQIQPNKYNPNRQSEHDFDMLKKSMEVDGFTQPVIVHRPTAEIVDGAHRWRAAQAVALTEIPVVFVDMTPEQMRVSTLRHNRARGSEDVELTAQVLRDLRELGALDWATEGLLLDDTELERLLDDIPIPEALAGEEFGTAWEVADRGDGLKTEQPGAIHGDNALSANAVDAIREREKQLSQARTAEERNAVEKDREILRISFTFTGEEARVVKAALGEQMADGLLALCQIAVDGSATQN